MKRWDVQQFSVKSLDYVEEVQHPQRMKLCTERPRTFCSTKAFECFSCHRWAGVWSRHHESTVHPSARRQTVCGRAPHESFCRICSSLSLLLPRGSGDNLRLPGLAGHLGATLHDDQRARRGLTVQAEAADHVLQSRAFGLPLLQKKPKDGQMNLCQLVWQKSTDALLWFVFSDCRWRVRAQEVYVSCE